MLLQVMFMVVVVVVVAVIGYGDVKPFAENGLVEYFLSLLHPSGCPS
jgi:hypothetical protein